ncbi:MAG: RNA-binding S4 domain-containing protein [Gammaproteobacteria bacterium]|jgi:ribosome-associated protein|nr:RNA-binding S4 domain-containing protein [Gammaproteobacteria bacterium]
MRDLTLKTQPVELYKILKFEGLASSGGAAKLAIESAEVMVNGIVETRKRKKIVAGDIIEYNGEKLRLLVKDQ